MKHTNKTSFKKGHPFIKGGEKGRNTIYFPELSNINPKATIGENCTLHAPIWIGDGVIIGDRVKIQAFVFIPPGVVINDDVFIAPHVVFTNDAKMELKGREGWQTTWVHKGAKIGANATILAGVNIGANATVGMGAVVLHDVPEGKTVVGNPAYEI